MLTAEQRKEFDRFGIVSVPGAIAVGVAKEMCDCVWNILDSRYGIRREDPATWQAQRITGTHDLPKSVTFEEIGCPTVCEALDDLLGRGNWQRPARWASLLVSFPDSAGRWDIPHKTWHLDFPASRSMSGLFAVRIFICLAKLGAGGGGTVFVAGSHRLVPSLASEGAADRLRSADARRALIRRYLWVKALCSFDEKVARVQQFMNRSAMVGEAELRVVEMTGDPGDIVLAHPLIMHAPASNCATVPRMALTSTVYRSGVMPSAPYR
jgi:Phytanoyl-CoA dioxygenase (PhyH)